MKTTGFCFKKDVARDVWCCTAAPIEIFPVATGRKVTGYLVNIRLRYVGQWPNLAQAKKRAQEIFEEMKLQEAQS